MKRVLLLLLCLALLLPGCASTQTAQVAATTLPVYQFATRLCEGTGITVTRLVTENVSCLHDYSLNIAQVKAAESADVIIISGAGLEDFMDDLLDHADALIDSSVGIQLLGCEGDDDHDHDHGHHHHEQDSHIWLSPANAKAMATNICQGLIAQYPAHQATFEKNLISLHADLDALSAYGHEQLSDLSSREMITFHDGFSYLCTSSPQGDLLPSLYPK